MKFVALALALLLAVGSQAASLQADAPSSLAHARAAVDVYLIQAKESVNNALAQLDDAEYKELKTKISQGLDNLHTQIKTLQGSVSPITDNVVSTIADATADFRASVMADIESVKAELQPKYTKLREVIDKHLEEYRTTLDPIVTEYYTKHMAEMETLKTKLEPVLEDLRTKMTTNIEETKTALMPIVETTRAKIQARLENLREMINPYVEEYKEQVKQAVSQAQAVSTDDLTAMREKIAPLAEEIKNKFQSIFEIISAAYAKS
ncbi:apolipoprotein A-I-like [Mastacembelus armatus]|uniref:Apolipoprotein A-I-like n=1 Tax=Mastacembelus armatus TaxID=205130 RepID=A0A7N9AWP5_9TELE|nr:apolipoprotein A-I-like [Mastacembelus armatus]